MLPHKNYQIDNFLKSIWIKIVSLHWPCSDQRPRLAETLTLRHVLLERRNMQVWHRSLKWKVLTRVQNNTFQNFKVLFRSKIEEMEKKIKNWGCTSSSLFRSAPASRSNARTSTCPWWAAAQAGVVPSYGGKEGGIIWVKGARYERIIGQEKFINKEWYFEYVKSGNLKEWDVGRILSPLTSELYMLQRIERCALDNFSIIKQCHLSSLVQVDACVPQQR